MGTIVNEQDEAYLDLQVNGYIGVDFNKNDLSPDELNKACQALQAGGVAGILATVITEDVAIMCRRLRRLVELREKDPLAAQLIVGLHIEGPFINEAAGYRGAHPLDSIRPADADVMKQLLDAGNGLTRIVTLAPERDPDMAVTRLVAAAGIAVSAGHTNASLDELNAAIDAGLTLFTHAGNGCPMEMHRHDNIIQRALSLAGKLSLMLIADGAHLPFFVLKNMIGLAGVENCIITTDAMAAAGLGPGEYTIGRWQLRIGDDMVARSPDNSHLVGSTVTMRRSRANLRDQLGLNADQLHQLMVANPRRAISMKR